MLSFFDIDSFLSDRFMAVSPWAFYSELFPPGSLQRSGALGDGKYCAIGLRIADSHARRYSITDGLAGLEHLLGNSDFNLMAPVSYAGKTREHRNARQLFAVAFDVDGIVERRGPHGLRNLLHQTERKSCPLPRPTYIVASGTGVHLYYFLDQPLPLWPDTLTQLDKLRHELTDRIWNRYVTDLHGSPQYESSCQGFRMVGTLCKDGRNRATAYRTGDSVSLDYLNSFVSTSSRIGLRKRSSMTLEQARKKWPEWYQAAVVERKEPRGWVCKRDLYEWWIRRIREGAVVGHRYYCLMCLAIYAQKCGIGYDELASDALALVPLLNSLGDVDGSEAFTAEHAMAAIEAYNKPRKRFPRKKIAYYSGIDIEPNKRNGRKRSEHLRRARAVQDSDYPNGEWRNVGGAPTKRNLVTDYAASHPGISVTEMAEALGISRTTVRKWMNNEGHNGKRSGQKE